MAKFVRSRPVRKSVNFNRELMYQWLTTLPATEPFCKDLNCPIRQYVGETNVSMYHIDAALVAAIDRECERSHVSWARLLPGQVMTIIDSLRNIRKEAT